MMRDVLLDGEHLYWKRLFTWLSLMMPVIVSYFVLTFLQRDLLDELWDDICYEPSVTRKQTNTSLEIIT